MSENPFLMKFETDTFATTKVFGSKFSRNECLIYLLICLNFFCDGRRFLCFPSSNSFLYSSQLSLLPQLLRLQFQLRCISVQQERNVSSI